MSLFQNVSKAQVFIGLLVAGMLFTGTINTLLNKLQDMACIEHCSLPSGDPKRKHFEQPIWQTLNMFLGEVACLLVYVIKQTMDKVSQSSERFHAIETVGETELPTESSPLLGNSRSPSPEVIEEDENHEFQREPLSFWGNFLFFLPTLCDLTATTLMNVGLIYVSASIYQMLRGSVVLFTGTLSVLFLKRRHPLYRWVALLTVFLGVGIVGFAGATKSVPIPSDDQHLDTHDTPVDNSLLGIFLIVLAQTFTAFQFVLEEKVMLKYEIPPIKAVGLEGLFGLVSVLVAMPILHFTLGIHGEPGNFFDVVGGFEQIVSHPQVLYAGIGIIFSIAFFNWFGLTVTRSLSATARSTIDTCRTLFIWLVSLGLGWESFKVLQVIGFVVLVYGTFLFNDVVTPPPCLPSTVDTVEEEDIPQEEI